MYYAAKCGAEVIVIVLLDSSRAKTSCLKSRMPWSRGMNCVRLAVGSCGMFMMG